MKRNSLVEIQNVVVEKLSRNLLIIQTLFENRLPPNFLFFSIIIFRLNWRARRAQRTPPAAGGLTVLLQIQTGSLGNPPTPSASDLTLELVRIDGIVRNFTQHSHLGSGTGWRFGPTFVSPQDGQATRATGTVQFSI
jgi:hypothetical protein